MHSSPNIGAATMDPAREHGAKAHVTNKISGYQHLFITLSSRSSAKRSLYRALSTDISRNDTTRFTPPKKAFTFPTFIEDLLFLRPTRFSLLPIPCLFYYYHLICFSP